MQSPKETLIDWLRDAHAMEVQAESMLKAQAGRLEHYPELKARIEQHITETQEQARLVTGCLSSLGADTATLKDAGGRMAAILQAIGGAVMGDEVIKGALAGYTFEQMEAASYRILITTARTCGETHVAEVCERILAEEEAMAAWLSAHMDGVTQQFLTRNQTEASDAHAKR